MARNHFLKKEVLTMDMVSRLQRLNDIATARSQTLSEMALAWLLKDSAVTSVLVGASSPQQILTDIKAVNNTGFTADELYEINFQDNLTLLLQL